MNRRGSCVGTFEVFEAAHVALRTLLAFSQPVNCIFWPIGMPNWLVTASKLHKHRETCCTPEWPFYSFLILCPYIQGIAEPIRRILNNCGIKVALKLFQTLGHIFTKPKDHVPTDQKTHAVYCIPCSDCEKVYLGQIKCQFCTRLKENIEGLFLILTAQNQLWLSMCVKQAITLRGKILDSLLLTIVMFNSFVWKPGISV